MNATNDNANSNICPACGTPFECGAKAGRQTCWCMALPPSNIVPPPEASCYCVNCLRQRLAAAAA